MNKTSETTKCYEIETISSERNSNLQNIAVTKYVNLEFAQNTYKLRVCAHADSAYHEQSKFTVQIFSNSNTRWEHLCEINDSSISDFPNVYASVEKHFIEYQKLDDICHRLIAKAYDILK